MPRDALEWLAARGHLDGDAEAGPAAEAPDGDPATTELGERVARAVAYVRRATAVSPMSEHRVRAALARRGEPAVVIDAALDRCRAEGLVDDLALARALTEEWRRRGHAPARIRRDLARRGITEEVIAAVVRDDVDLDAAAFAAARDRIARLGALEDEVAFRRTVAYLIRRGYPEELARRATRQALWSEREPRRSAER